MNSSFIKKNVGGNVDERNRATSARRGRRSARRHAPGTWNTDLRSTQATTFRKYWYPREAAVVSTTMRQAQHGTAARRARYQRCWLSSAVLRANIGATQRTDRDLSFFFHEATTKQRCTNDRSRISLVMKNKPRNYFLGGPVPGQEASPRPPNGGCNRRALARRLSAGLSR